MKLLAVLAVLIAPSCQWVRAGRTLSPAHLAYIRAESFAPVRRASQFPPAVARLLADLPFDRIVVAGCSRAHCLVEYEQSADRRVFGLEIVGLSEEGASIEWRAVATERAHDLGALKRLAAGR